MPVGSTIWATGNVAYAGAFVHKSEDLGGVWTWAAAKCINKKFNNEYWDGAEGSGTGTDGSICPDGWRLPSRGEFNILIGLPAGSTDDGNGVAVYTAGVGLLRTGDDGNLLLFPDAGSGGYYWSSSEYTGVAGRLMRFNSSIPYGTVFDGFGKESALSVRCVKSAS